MGRRLMGFDGLLKWMAGGGGGGGLGELVSSPSMLATEKPDSRQEPLTVTASFCTEVHRSIGCRGDFTEPCMTSSSKFWTVWHQSQGWEQLWAERLFKVLRASWE